MAIVASIWSAPAAATWNEAISKHFHVYADESPDDLKAFATKLERFDAAVRQARGTPDVDAGASTQVTVYVLRDIAAIRNIYGDRDSGVAGFYVPRATGSVAFVPRAGEVGTYELSAESIFFHEYTHHLMLEDTDRPLPTWLVEGFAEFFAVPRFESNGGVTLGLPPRYRAEVLYDQGMGGLSLPRMLAGDYTTLDELQFESLYGRGWLLTHLLSFDLKRRGQLSKYIDEISAGKPALQAATDAFGDLNQLDRELNAYFKADKFTVATIPASALHLPPIEVRPLSPAMAELMDTKIRFAREGKRYTAPTLVGRARSVVQRYPADAQAATLLAQIENSAKQYDAAARDADTALKLDPRSEQAELAKGEALMNIAKANPTTADWNGVRTVLSTANRMDVEDAQPLILFFRSYSAANQQPTSNAIDGLKYAILLAPQDAKLRLEAVGAFLKGNRPADAREVLLPLAYSPHAGKSHDAVRKILDQIDAKNIPQAIVAWQAAEKLYDDD
ncbi:hypothetical protein [Sphingomonas sp.]|uniref:hypothetical protein n=1 Tax=Sphingomonas sp. TaxID=28214 RepID=UPI0025D242A4|nr:hypothetical protein [Sphingomonas sp.]MBV9529290.1 hypothetical protein [Sphingomonas sp.]